MAIPAPTFFHTFASLTPDYPTTGLTESNPGGDSDPGISGGIGTFDSNNKCVMWTAAAVPFISGGTGDFTIALRMQVTTGSGGHGYLQIGQEGSRNVTVQIHSGDAGSKVLKAAYTVTDAKFVADSTSPYVNSTYAIWTFRRSGSTCTVWKDGVEDTAAGADFGALDLNATPYLKVTLGGLSDGSGNVAGLMDWVAVFDSAVADADIPNLDESNIAATLSAGGSVLVRSFDVMSGGMQDMSGGMRN